MDTWLACHEFEPSAVENPPCREGHSYQVYRGSNITLTLRGCFLRDFIDLILMCVQYHQGKQLENSIEHHHEVYDRDCWTTNLNEFDPRKYGVSVHCMS
ncbi:hypothetical protein TNCV_1652621 [Trichonephila clavipes]|nr:hypothetical protein TNCV_1652621 [Trichonephila clavipes]